ncbi:hypothetical protein [Methylovorus glucosotrophus]|uniref:Uncharacterized protein n=1 Tax=Methylovorus glucosotrophus (strain SIP3-4) TaxID=582744 RepID=C6XEA9_METGS|nr:hypothetical protein [Methylovorus glucosotrophus]ACT50884.1 hypothetical protein Msip34_1639 [Methylovorus glucosotrophus SIP3-4]
MALPNPVELALAAKSMKENMPALLAMQELEAKLLRQKFLSLCSEGFTQEQALELCKKGP